MKRIQWVVSVVVVCAMAVSAVGAGDVFTELGVKKADVHRQIAASFADGYVPVGEVRTKLRAASPAARVAIVEQVLVATKAFVSTPEFAKVYAQYRNEMKPGGPEGGSVAALIAKNKKEAQQNLAETKQMVAQAPKEQRAELNQMLRDAEEQLKIFDSAEYRQMMEEQFAADQESYKEQIAEWNKQYPADPRVAVKQRLREFLETSKSVDYNAKLVSQGGRQRFASEAYEQQSSEWKLCFRAGKAPVEKARAFAQQWLAELQ